MPLLEDFLLHVEVGGACQQSVGQFQKRRDLVRLQGQQHLDRRHQVQVEHPLDLRQIHSRCNRGTDEPDSVDATC